MKDKNDNNYQVYVREIARFPRITARQEVELAFRMQKNDHAARQELIQSNLRLVVKIALEYGNLGVPLLDLISEGNIGLMRAVERFDPAKGGKLSTFASYWIQQRIKRALLNQGKMIRLPSYVAEKIAKVRRVAMQMRQELGYDPTAEEVAEEIGMSAHKVKALLSASQHTSSLDQLLGEDTDQTLADLVMDESTNNPSEIVGDEDMRVDLVAVVATLTPREQMVINARFGLDDENPLTLVEVGAKMGFTRERIRQLQNSALRKLRKKILDRKTVSLVA